jgi:hypothetical protein
MLEIKIGMDNFTGVACGVGFEASIARVDLREDAVQVKRLKALFRGTTVRNLDAGAGHSEAEARVAQEAEQSALEARPGPVPTSPQKNASPAILEHVPQETPLAVGDIVLADYKDDMRRGRIVKVLDKGLVHVAIDGDDAKYRVLDAEKVVKE